MDNRSFNYEARTDFIASLAKKKVEARQKKKEKKKKFLNSAAKNPKQNNLDMALEKKLKAKEAMTYNLTRQAVKTDPVLRAWRSFSSSSKTDVHGRTWRLFDKLKRLMKETVRRFEPRLTRYLPFSKFNTFEWEKSLFKGHFPVSPLVRRHSALLCGRRPLTNHRSKPYCEMVGLREKGVWWEPPTKFVRAPKHEGLLLSVGGKWHCFNAKELAYKQVLGRRALDLLATYPGEALKRLRPRR